MSRKLSSIAITVFCAFLLMALTAAVFEENANAASKVRMPSKAKYQYKSGGKWKTQYTLKYKYNKKGDLIKIVTSQKDVPNTTIKYTYKNGKKKTATLKEGKDSVKVNYDKKGRISNYKQTLYIPSIGDEGGFSKDVCNGKYTYNKKGNLKTWKFSVKSEEEQDYSETYKFKTTYSKKGWVSMIVATSSMKEKNTYKYGSSGLLESVKFSSATPIKYKYKYNKDGTVKQMLWNDGDGTGYGYRMTYTYGSSRGSSKEYKWMLNADYRSIARFSIHRI